jgi:hypothetical protein
MLLVWIGFELKDKNRVSAEEFCNLICRTIVSS